MKCQLKRKLILMPLTVVILGLFWGFKCVQTPYSKRSRGFNDDKLLDSAFPPDLYTSSANTLNTKLYKNKDSDNCQPHSLHLAPCTDVDTISHEMSMTISFMLDFNHCKHVQVLVFYGRTVDLDNKLVEKSVASPTDLPLQFSYTSTKSDGLYTSDWIYHIELPNLQAGLEEYWYQVVVFQDENDSSLERNTPSLRNKFTAHQDFVAKTDLNTFRTSPLPGSPTTIALVGDLGQNYNSTTTMLQIYKGVFDDNLQYPISNLLIAGDLSYADTDPYRWPSWFQLMQPVLRSLPLTVAAGNHEVECDIINGNIFLFYENLFRNPNQLGPAEIYPVNTMNTTVLRKHWCATPSSFQSHYLYGNAFYAYTHGLVRIIVLSSYSDTHVGSIQYQWAKEELAKVDRAVTPWVLVAFHSPIYSTYVKHYGEIEETQMKDAMEISLFNAYNVNIVLSGHDHAYCRTFPLQDDKVDPTGKAPIYLTLGTGGHRKHHAVYRNNNPEEWVAKRIVIDYGYGQLHFANATHAHFSWVRDEIEQYGIDDAVWISNPHASITQKPNSHSFTG